MTQERIGRLSKRLRVRCAHDMPAVRLVGHGMTIQCHCMCRTLPVLPHGRSPCSFFANTRTCRHALTPAWHSRSGRYKSIVYCLAARSFSAGAPSVPARSLSRHPFRPWKPYSWGQTARLFLAPISTVLRLDRELEVVEFAPFALPKAVFGSHPPSTLLLSNKGDRVMRHI